MKQLGLLLTVGLLLATVNGRVYYLQNLDGNRYGDVNYPIPEEQSSRDLDLSFSAGDSGETDNAAHPGKKVYMLVAPERQLAEISKPSDRPVYYKLTETPVQRKTASDNDVIVLPEKERKLVKINGNNKGEVILELRVIANHDSA